jgi:hypothetical protein
MGIDLLVPLHLFIKEVAVSSRSSVASTGLPLASLAGFWNTSRLAVGAFGLYSVICDSREVSLSVGRLYL